VNVAESEPVSSPETSWRLLLVGAAFFMSGGAALVYQVAWQRILELSSGVGIYSVAMIVAAFMAGLGIGSHVGSLLSLRLNARSALWAFAARELGVAAFGSVSSVLEHPQEPCVHLGLSPWATAPLPCPILRAPVNLGLWHADNASHRLLKTVDAFPVGGPADSLIVFSSFLFAASVTTDVQIARARACDSRCGPTPSC
jgi:hypothetical protein